MGTEEKLNSWTTMGYVLRSDRVESWRDGAMGCDVMCLGLRCRWGNIGMGLGMGRGMEMGVKGRVRLSVHENTWRSVDVFCAVP